MELGHWEYDNGDFDINEWFGFIYRISEKHTGKEYIGKKQFFSFRTKVVKDRKNKKHYKKESDWKVYTGSSKELNAAIELNGKDNYKFVIESLYKSKGSLHYAEVECQIIENVLREKLPNGERKFYNGHINAVKFIPKDDITDEHRSNLSEAMKLVHRYRKYPELKIQDAEKKNNARKEKISKAMLLLYKNHPERKEELSQQNSGESNYFYGKKHTENSRQKMSSGRKGKCTGSQNKMTGRSCFDFMTDEEILEFKSKVSEKAKRPRSALWKSAVSKSLKGKKKEIITCPYCNKNGGINNMYRYHFDKCKFKTANEAECSLYPEVI